MTDDVALWVRLTATMPVASLTDAPLPAAGADGRNACGITDGYWADEEELQVDW